MIINHRINLVGKIGLALVILGALFGSFGLVNYIDQKRLASKPTPPEQSGQT